jgi:hypothetical protein
MIIILCFEKSADNSNGGLMLKRVCIAVVIGVSLNLSAGAAMVSFYVVETGASEETAARQSMLWENAFMEVFFDAGYIISNAPVLRLEKRPSDILQVIDINEAGISGIDYMLIVLLDYKTDAQVSNEVSFFVYRVVKREKIIEKNILIRQSRTARDEYDNMKSIARGFVPYIGE